MSETSDIQSSLERIPLRPPATMPPANITMAALWTAPVGMPDVTRPPMADGRFYTYERSTVYPWGGKPVGRVDVASGAG
jgi:hypothetical protein